jgi:hypothetical protein
MFRIKYSRSGFYYVQQYDYRGWKMRGPFCRNLPDARRLARLYKYGGSCDCTRVIEYV